MYTWWICMISYLFLWWNLTPFCIVITLQCMIIAFILGNWNMYISHPNHCYFPFSSQPSTSFWSLWHWDQRVRQGGSITAECVVVQNLLSCTFHPSMARSKTLRPLQLPANTQISRLIHSVSGYCFNNPFCDCFLSVALESSSGMFRAMTDQCTCILNRNICLCYTGRLLMYHFLIWQSSSGGRRFW